jgi:signal transduction histidine kinase
MGVRSRQLRSGSNGRVSWVEISNTGPELTDTDVKQLLEPFQRASPNQAQANGVGLGLSIVAAVTRAHAGSITLRRPAGDGGGLTARLQVPSRRGDRSDISTGNASDPNRNGADGNRVVFQS